MTVHFQRMIGNREGSVGAPWSKGRGNGREQEEGISLDGFGVVGGHVSELGCNRPWRPGRRSPVLKGWLEQTKFFGQH